MSYLATPSARFSVFGASCIVFLVFALASSPVQAQDDNPFDTVQDRRTARIEAIEKQQAQREQRYQEVLDSLSPTLTEAERELAFSFMAELLRTCEKTENELLKNTDKHDEEIYVHRTRNDELFAEVMELQRELASSVDSLHTSENDTDKQSYALHDIQEWFAHALKSVDRPELQTWVLAHLADSPDTLRVLQSQTPWDGSPDDYNHLEMTIRELSLQAPSRTQKLASKLLFVLDPDLAEYLAPPLLTSSWPIVAEPGREGEQELIRKLERSSEFVYYDVQLGELLLLFDEMYDITILTKHSELDREAIDLSVEVTLNAKKVSLRTALTQVLQEHDLAFVIRDDAIVITTQQDADANPTRRVYDLTEHRLLQDGGNIESTLESLQATMGSDVESIIAIGNRIVVTADEEGHYEIAKLITLLHDGE